MKKKHEWMVIAVVLMISVLFSGCGPGQFLGKTVTPSPTPTLAPTRTPTLTPKPTFTLTPSPTLTATERPLSFAVIKSSITDDLLGIVVESELDPFSGPILIGLSFLNKESYVVDETGARLDFVEAKSNESGQLVVVFAGASSNHQYQLIQPNKPPIDLFPE